MIGSWKTWGSFAGSIGLTPIKRISVRKVSEKQ